MDQGLHSSLLLAAAKDGNLDLVQSLVAAGHDLEERQPASYKENHARFNGFIALHWAGSWGTWQS